MSLYVIIGDFSTGEYWDGDTGNTIQTYAAHFKNRWAAEQAVSLLDAPNKRVVRLRKREKEILGYVFKRTDGSYYHPDNFHADRKGARVFQPEEFGGMDMLRTSCARNERLVRRVRST